MVACWLGLVVLDLNHLAIFKQGTEVQIPTSIGGFGGARTEI